MGGGWRGVRDLRPEDRLGVRAPRGFYAPCGAPTPPRSSPMKGEEENMGFPSRKRTTVRKNSVPRRPGLEPGQPVFARLSGSGCPGSSAGTTAGWAVSHARSPRPVTSGPLPEAFAYSTRRKPSAPVSGMDPRLRGREGVSGLCDGLSGPWDFPGQPGALAPADPDGSIPRRRRRLRRRGRARLGVGAAEREADGDAGPLVLHAVDARLAAMQAHQAVDDGEAEARSA